MPTSSTVTLGRLTAPHWKGHATSSPSLPSGDGEKIVFGYVPTGVKVGIKGVTAMFTDKMCLIMPVGFGSVTALTALLRGVACVKIHNTHSLCLCFVLYKPLKLSKVPAVQPSSILLSCFDPLSYAFEFLKDNNTASRHKADYLFSYLMVNSNPKPLLLLGELLKVSLCRRSAFGLETASDCLVSLRHSPYVPTVEEPVYPAIRCGHNGKVFKSQINTYNKAIRLNVFFVFFYCEVEKKLFESFIVLQGSGLNFPVRILLKVFRHNYSKPLPAIDSGKGHLFFIKPHGIGTFIVPDGRVTALRAFGFKSFSESLYGRFEAFGSYHSCGDNELRGKRKLFSQGVVGEFMEFNAVPKFVIPTHLASVVIGLLVLINGLEKRLLLSAGGLYGEFDSALKFHIHILTQYLLTFKVGLLSSLTEGVSDRRSEAMKKGKFVVIKCFPEEVEVKLNDLIRQGYGVEVVNSVPADIGNSVGLIVTAFIHKENQVMHRVGGTE